MMRSYVGAFALLVVLLTCICETTTADDASARIPSLLNPSTNNDLTFTFAQSQPSPAPHKKPFVPAPAPAIIPEATVETGCIVISVLFALCCSTCFCWYRWNRKRRYAMWADEDVDAYVQL